MSKKNHNLFGVPHYAPSDTPAVRQTTVVPPEPTKEELAELASAAQRRRDNVKWFQENWKIGDRFIYTHRIRDYDHPKSLKAEDVRAWQATEHEEQWAGTIVRFSHNPRSYATWVVVQFDGGKKLRGGRSSIGLSDFRRSTRKINASTTNETCSPSA